MLLEEKKNEEEGEKLNKGMEQIIERLEQEETRQKHFETQIQKKIQDLAGEFTMSLDNLQLENREILREFNREGEEKLQSFNVLLKKDNKEFFENTSGQEQILSAETERVRKDIEVEAADRTENMQFLETQMMEELAHVEDEININIQVRNETNNKLREMIENLHQDLEKKIEFEQRERENSNNSLLNLLEESCNKIECYFAG